MKSGKWRKGKEEEQGQRLEKRKAWSLEIAGLTQAVIESVFGLVVNFRTYSFIRNWNRRSGSPPTAENAENSAFCLVLAQEQLLSCVNRLTQGVNRIEMAGRGRDDAAIAEALGMLAGVLGGNPNVVGMGAARQLSEFQKNNPPMFKGAYDPDGA
ncbi:hypothetical protein KIW84_070708 [Lathyrus oleraceus]|uniref:Uncharacterized protein n=1 Tax=Pisum sativum TaxID=3888 RepID=A0A9D4VIQ3_PEA|nr:hypothetical protein KIW84_070708 [Pisum sativum]